MPEAPSSPHAEPERLVDDLKARPDAPPVEIIDPARVDRVPDPKRGGERWKLTCLCGKRIHAPFNPQVPTGRCPSCGRRMRLPGFKGSTASPPRKPAKIAPELAETQRRLDPPAPKAALPETEPLMPQQKIQDAAAALAETKRREGPPAVDRLADTIATRRPPAAPPPKAQENAGDLELQKAPDSPAYRPGSPSSTLDVAQAAAAETAAAESDPEDEVGTIVMDPAEQEELTRQIKQEGRVSREAALRTADMLRKHHSAGESGSGFGRISAWPLAGRLPRTLAGFIDLTLAMLVTGFAVALTSLKVLPDGFNHPAVLGLIFFFTGLFNDCVLEWTGGSLGKRLVVLTVRSRTGIHPDGPRTILRGVVKWLILPGWLIAYFDPAERALHDLVCGTLVLKGRTRG
ncbi:MAG: RDD family protein [Planctomycetota bacterium]|nr:RDD family protein [Planctomycetota bacterium]